MGGYARRLGLALTKVVRETGPGARIELKTGEYLGTLIIDKPLELAGDGPVQPALGGIGQPAVVVAAHGVYLRNLYLADALNIKSAPSIIIIEEYDHPQLLTEVTCEGVILRIPHEFYWSLGDQLPNTTVEHYVEIDTVPARIYHSGGAKWLQGSLPVLAAPDISGRYLLRFQTVTTNTLRQKEIGITTLLVKADDSSRQIWLTLDALPTTTPVLKSDQLCLQVGKRVRVFFSHSLLIGKQLLGNFSITEQIAEKQCLIVQEQGQTWSIRSPWRTEQPTIVSGESLAYGQRMLLYTNCSIRIVGQDFSLSSPLRPATIAVNPTKINLSSNTDIPNQQSLQVSGSKRQLLDIISLVPWLDIDAVESKSSGVTVTVSTNAHIADLPGGRHIEWSALLVMHGQEALVIPAEVITPEKAIDVTDGELEEEGSGEISAFHQDPAPSSHPVFDEIQNDGRKISSDCIDVVFPLAPVTTDPAPWIGKGNIEYIPILAGRFLFGMDDEEREIERPFSIGKYPVTNEQYLQFVKETGHRIPTSWRQDKDGNVDFGGPATGRHPVTGVSKVDADAFCKWAGVRLPTEEEWERSARSTDGRFFPWSAEDENLERTRIYTAYYSTKPNSVDNHPKGKSVEGVYDLIGNIWQWTATMEERFHILKGGYHGYSNKSKPLDARTKISADSKTVSPSYGFRCCSDRIA